MRITQWGEFGVHFCIYLARRERASAEPTGASEIAAHQKIAPEYAQQILQRLRKGGLIASVRGPLGGYRLARPAGEITLLDILIAAEGESFEVICETKPLDSVRCAEGQPCALRPLWYELRACVDSFLSSYTLERLAFDADVSPPAQQLADHGEEFVRLGARPRRADDDLPSDSDENK